MGDKSGKGLEGEGPQYHIQKGLGFVLWLMGVGEGL